MNGNKNYVKLERNIKNRSGRKVSIYSVNPYMVFFSIGCVKKERKEKFVAKEVAKNFSHPDNQIWIHFNEKQNRWVVKIEADTIIAVARKIKLVFGKYILPEMRMEYERLIEQNIQQPQNNAKIPVISDILPLISN